MAKLTKRERELQEREAEVTILIQKFDSQIRILSDAKKLFEKWANGTASGQLLPRVLRSTAERLEAMAHKIQELHQKQNEQPPAMPVAVKQLSA